MISEVKVRITSGCQNGSFPGQVFCARRRFSTCQQSGLCGASLAGFCWQSCLCVEILLCPEV